VASRAVRGYTHGVALTLVTSQVLLCVSDDGGIYPYSVDGELLPWQLSLGAECAAQRVAEAHVTPTSVVVLTREAQLFVVRSAGTRCVTRLRADWLAGRRPQTCPSRASSAWQRCLSSRRSRTRLPVRAASLRCVCCVSHGVAAFAVLPRPKNGSGELQVLLAVGHTVWTVVRACVLLSAPCAAHELALRMQDAARAVDQATQFGRVLRMEVTHDGASPSRASVCQFANGRLSLYASRPHAEPLLRRRSPTGAPGASLSRARWPAPRLAWLDSRSAVRGASACAFRKQRGPYRFPHAYHWLERSMSDRTFVPHFQSSLPLTTRTGNWVALFSESGRLWVLSPDLRTPLCEFDARGEFAESPCGMAWCGADAVVLHWPEVLLMVGPYGDAVRWPLDAPAALAPECDGLRVLTTDAHVLLRRIPDPLARCAGVGSTAPGAMLTDALEAFDRGSARADEALRAVAESLQDAASDCLEAALHAWEPAQQRTLLRAAAFGAAHVPLASRRAAVAVAATGALGLHAETCRSLRVLNAVRHHADGGIPLTGAQYAALPGGPGGLIGRLLAARRHLLALRLCEFLGLPPARVMLHWAAAKMGASLALSDRQLLDVLMEKLRSCPGIPFGVVASEALRRGRPRLAALLLDYEQRSGEQVPLLTSMGEDDRALAKAVESGDTDLMYLAVFNMYRKQPTFATFAECVARRPEARNLFVAHCRRTDRELLKSFLYAAGDAAGTADAIFQEALTGIAVTPGDVSREGEAGTSAALDLTVAGKLMEQAAELYSKCKLDFAAWAVADAAKLLKAQQELEFADAPRGVAPRARRPPGSKYTYVGSSLADTVLRALLEGHVKAAAKLRADLRLSDRHWAWLRARAAVAQADWDALSVLSDEKKLPIDHAALVELALNAGAPKVELVRLIQRVKDPGVRAEWFTAAGLTLQAQAAAAEAADASVSYGARASSLFSQTWGRLTVGLPSS